MSESPREKALRILELAARAVVARTDFEVASCCDGEERMCEMYGCSSLRELVAPLERALSDLERLYDEAVRSVDREGEHS